MIIWQPWDIRWIIPQKIWATCFLRVLVKLGVRKKRLTLVCSSIWVDLICHKFWQIVSHIFFALLIRYRLFLLTRFKTWWWIKTEVLVLMNTNTSWSKTSTHILIVYNLFSWYLSSYQSLLLLLRYTPLLLLIYKLLPSISKIRVLSTHWRGNHS